MITDQDRPDRDTSTTTPSPKTSPKSSTVDLSKLTTALAGLLASVRVTASTPIARTNAQMAVQTMAEVLLKFPIGLTMSVIEQMKNDPGAVWPTTGEMVGRLRDVSAEQSQPLPGMGATAARPHKPNANINGWRYDQIINRTKQGRQAKAEGRPHSFLQDLIQGRKDLPSEMASPP